MGTYNVLLKMYVMQFKWVFLQIINFDFVRYRTRTLYGLAILKKLDCRGRKKSKYQNFVPNVYNFPKFLHTIAL